MKNAVSKALQGDSSRQQRSESRALLQLTGLDMLKHKSTSGHKQRQLPHKPSCKPQIVVHVSVSIMY